jgi:MoaA/NifB/PqqE/SkfB family radical SAM enzyme
MLDVIVTSECNLRCSYCYQNAKGPGVMGWDTLRPALDLLMRLPRDGVRVHFIGGEPLLAFDVIERAAEYIKTRKPPALDVRYAVTTNGLALGRREARFLAANRFHIKLSFDGVRRMQQFRGSGTFARLDRLLDDLRTRHPSMFASRLSVGVTLTPKTIPSLAMTVRYLLRKQVADFYVAPAMIPATHWNRRLKHDLRLQFERVYDACRSFYRRTGRIPLRWLRPEPDPDEASSLSDWYCGIGSGEALTLDVDGTLHGCVTVASSYQRFPPTRLGRSVERLRLGRIGDPRLPSRLASYHAAVRATGLFNNRHQKYSSYGRCSTCRSRARCVICPTAILQGGGDDPDRVPDFVCAFNRLSVACSKRFPSAAVARLRETSHGKAQVHQGVAGRRDNRRGGSA